MSITNPVSNSAGAGAGTLQPPTGAPVLPAGAPSTTDQTLFQNAMNASNAAQPTSTHGNDGLYQSITQMMRAAFPAADAMMLQALSEGQYLLQQNTIMEQLDKQKDIGRAIEGKD
jgi:hypothetical protein